MTKTLGTGVVQIICLLLVASTTALAQGSTTATLRGNIQDSSGAVLPGATVTLTNTGTRGVQTTVSDDRGQYLLAGLFPGTYDLKVELSGFKSYQQRAITLLRHYGIEAVVQDRLRGLGAVALPPRVRQVVVRELDLGAGAFDRLQRDAADELACRPQ